MTREPSPDVARQIEQSNSRAGGALGCLSRRGCWCAGDPMSFVNRVPDAPPTVCSRCYYIVYSNLPQREPGASLAGSARLPFGWCWCTRLVSVLSVRQRCS